MALLGAFLVSHTDHIRHTLEQLNFLNRFNDPAHVQNKFPGATRISDDCMFNLRNGDEERGTLQEFQVPWGAIKDLLSFIGFENAPFEAMTAVTSIAQSLFYPTDDEHVDELLGYYRQREWRITAGYFVNEAPRGRTLDENEKQCLIDLDNAFWKRELGYKNETFRRVDRAVSLSQPNPGDLFEMATRLIVPSEKIHETRQLFGDLSIEVGRSEDRHVQ